MSLVSRNLCRAAPRKLIPKRTSLCPSAKPIRPIVLGASSCLSKSISAPFSTMGSLKSSVAAVPADAKAFDPEIVDMASYIHNFDIKSDLAVSMRPNRLNELLNSASVRYSSLRFPRYTGLWTQGSRISPLHWYAWACCGGHRCPQWCKLKVVKAGGGANDDARPRLSVHHTSSTLSLARSILER